MFEVPLKQNVFNSASILVKKKETDLQIKKVKTESSLIIQKSTENDSVRYFVVTVIGEYYGKGDASEVKPFSYNGDRRKFNGYMIISDVNGEFLTGYFYNNGGRQTIHIASETKLTNNEQYTIIRFHKKTAATKGGDGYSSGEDKCDYPNCGGTIVNGMCTKCGELYYGGGVFPADGVYCSLCHNFIAKCICPTPCSYCGETYCNGECQQFDFCTNCGRQLINGKCPECDRDDDDNDNGGGQDNPPPTPVQDTMYTVSVEVIGNGTATGGGSYKKGDNAILSVLEINSTFGGWLENGSLLSSEKLYVIQVSSPRSFKALFHDLNSDCANLIKRYKNNLSLKSVLDSLNSKRSLIKDMEHAYTMSTRGITSYFQGTATGVYNVTFSSNYKYDCIVHNHLTTPIPSVDDIIALHQAYEKGSFQKGSFILMQTSNGTISIEIENWEQFDSFVATSLVDDESIKLFKKTFHEYILDNPTDSELQDVVTINKAINFYSKDKGLKIAYSESDGTGTDWSYAIQNNNTLTFKDCTQL